FERQNQFSGSEALYCARGYLRRRPNVNSRYLGPSHTIAGIEWPRSAREKNANRSLAISGRADAEADATPRVTRAPARNRSNRSVVKNRRRLHRRALRPGRVARRRL